jgi:hypothetical protein
MSILQHLVALCGSGLLEYFSYLLAVLIIVLSSLQTSSSVSQ